MTPEGDRQRVALARPVEHEAVASHIERAGVVRVAAEQPPPAVERHRHDRPDVGIVGVPADPSRALARKPPPVRAVEVLPAGAHCPQWSSGGPACPHASGPGSGGPAWLRFIARIRAIRERVRRSAASRSYTGCAALRSSASCAGLARAMRPTAQKALAKARSEGGLPATCRTVSSAAARSTAADRR